MPGQLRMRLYIRSGIAACNEDPVRALDFLMKAADCYEQVKMPLRGQLLRYRLGEVHPGPDSRAQHNRAEQWLQEQGIVAPARWAGMYAPGYAKIAGDSIETTF